MPEIALLTNPSAGSGRGAKARAVVLPRLRAAGLVVRDLVGAHGAEAAELAQQCVRDGVDSIVICGGDGLVHIAAQAVAGTATSLGLIPAGSGNDAARSLGLPLRDPRAAADRVIAGRTRVVDLARSPGAAGQGSGAAYFVTVLAAGFDALVNERANQLTWPRGQMRYNVATLAELRTFRPIHYRLDLDGREVEVEAMLVAVGNGPSFGGGLRITEGALLDDGLLDVVVIGAMSRLELVRTYPKLFRGTHVAHPKYELHRVKQVHLAAEGIVTYADGERFGPLPLRVECAPRALTVIV